MPNKPNDQNEDPLGFDELAKALAEDDKPAPATKAEDVQRSEPPTVEQPEEPHNPPPENA
jgi:hypothetical protein